MLPDVPAQTWTTPRAGIAKGAMERYLFYSQLLAKTVRNQVSTIFSKLQVVSRSEAIIKAREAGFEND